MFILPIVAYFLFLIVYFDKKKNIAESIVVSWLFVTLYSWIVMELFSAFKLVNTISTLIAWCIICTMFSIMIIKNKLVGKTIAHCRNDGQINGWWKKHRVNFICLCVFSVMICFFSILRSQNLIDNMYHRLSKIMHWIQNGKVGYFATWTTPEIKYSNLTEYMMAQIYLLKGADRFITIVQVGAYICSGCCIYGISRKIGASSRYALLSVWIFFLTPIVVIETITTQTDVVAGSYLLSFIYFLLDYIQSDKLYMNREGVLSVVYLSASVLFGYLAKPTVCFAMVLFFGWMCVVRLVKRDKIKVLFRYMVVGIAVAAILFLPDVLRNYEYKTAQNIVYMEDNVNDSMVSSEAKNAMESITKPKEFMIVCIRNLAANSTSRCFPRVNDLILRLVEKCESVLSYSPKPDFQVMVGGELGETSEPSPVIMFFLLVSWVCVLVRISKVKKEQFLYMLFATLSLLVQAGLMGYTLFRQRYLIGVMAVLCPAFVVVLENLRIGVKMRLNIMVATITICCFGTINTLTYEVPYSLFGFQGEKLHQYLFSTNHTELYYQLLLNHINKNEYKTVGMYGAISYEYVLWQGIENLERMEHVNVKPTYQGAKLEDMEFLPQCIVEEVSVKEGPDWLETIYCHGKQYVCEYKIMGENGRNYAVLVQCE